MKSFTPQETIRALNLLLDIEQHVSGLKYLKELVGNIAKTFEAKVVLVGHAITPENDSVQTDVVWLDDDFSDNFIYRLKDTPCEDVFSGKRVCVYPDDVAGKFPQDKLLEELGVKSYIGAPMLGGNGDLLGVIALMDDKPVEDAAFFTAIVEFLAVRIGLELKRNYMEEELKRQVVERTSELEESNKELTTALAEIKTLRGIIPICAACKSIRDDQGFWQQVESYVTEHTDASFTHGYCPKCVEKIYGDLDCMKK